MSRSPSHRPDESDAPVSLSGKSPKLDATRAPPTRAGATMGPASVIQVLASRMGVESQVLLGDEDSANGVSPVLQGGANESQPEPARGGNYQLLGEIARGGMGVVLKGHDSDLGRDVAMKVLLEKHADNPTMVRRFVEEAQIGGQLQHPGIVPVYGLGLMEDERPYFTMKLVKGRTLAALLADRADPTEDRHRFLTIFEQVCQTIAYAHARKVIHRDLKPANIMVGAFGEAQVVDWGLAKVMQQGGVRDEQVAREAARPQVSIIETVRSGSTSGGTESLVGSVMGTPSYMSPEQAQGEIDRLDERTDVFALGSILCEILTGSPVYGGRHALDQATRADLGAAHERLSASDADESMLTLVKRCLTPARRGRPRNAEVLVKEMQQYLEGREERTRQAQIESAEARVRAENERKARRLTLALALAVLVIVVGGGGSWLVSEMRSATEHETLSREVSTRLAEASRLRGEDDFKGAVASASLARTYLADRQAPADLVAQVEDSIEEFTIAAEDAHRAIAEEQRLAAFLKALEGVQFSARTRSRISDDQSRREVAFRAIFAAYGLDVFASPPDPTVEAIIATGHAEIIALSLDEWGRLARTRFGWRSKEYLALNALAQAVDADVVRGRMREALLEEDRGTLEAFVSSKAASNWPPETVLMFAAATVNIGFAIDVEPLLRACQQRHRDNAHVSLALGRLLRFQDPPDHENAIPFLMAALAAQPDFAWAKQSLAVCLVEAGRTEEAAFTAIDLLENHPDATWISDYAFDYLTPLWQSKDRELTLNVFEAAVAHHPDVPEFRTGLSSCLLSAPPKLRDPNRALGMAQELLENPEQMEPWAQHFCWVTLATCYSWTDRDQEALAALDNAYAAEERENGGTWYLHAILLARNGRQAEGWAYFERAQKQYDEAASGDRRTDSLYGELKAEARLLYRD